MKIPKNAPRLALRLESVMRCDYHTLDQFIENVTGHKYESASSEEWARNGFHRYAVNGEMEGQDAANWKHFKKTGKYKNYTLRAILNGLASEGYLQTGLYLFDTF
jgi:hypothetical protein